MAAKSDLLEAHILNYFRGTTFPAVPAAGFEVALYSVAPTDAGGGTELTGNGYARAAIAAAAGSWTAPGAGGSMSNAVEVTFPVATGSNWLTAVAWGLFNKTSGELMYHAALTANKTVAVGDQARFPVGSLVISEA